MDHQLLEYNSAISSFCARMCGKEPIRRQKSDKIAEVNLQDSDTSDLTSEIGYQNQGEIAELQEDIERLNREKEVMETRISQLMEANQQLTAEIRRVKLEKDDSIWALEESNAQLIYQIKLLSSKEKI